MVFNQLQLVFNKTPILWHFNLEYYIWIQTNTSSYDISVVLNLLIFKITLDGIVTKTNLSQWHLIAFFSRKIISAKTWYKIYSGKILAIIKAFKTWQHGLKDYKVIIFIDYNIQHTLSIYVYKKPEPQIGLLSLKAFILLFSN